MKIAIWHNLPSGGGSRALNYHINGLHQRNHYIEIWSNSPDADGFMQIPMGIKVHQIPLIRNKKISFRDKIKSVFFEKDQNILDMEAHCQRCADEINNGDFDVLFANSCFYYAVPFIAKYIKIPKVLYLGEPFRFFYESLPRLVWEAPRGVAGQLFRRSYWLPILEDLWVERKNRVQLREERKNYEAFDKVLVNSIYSAESCLKAYGSPAEVCYLGIDSSIFKENQIASSDYVIGLGNFYINKNPRLAIEALAEMKQNKPKLIWVANMVDKAYSQEMSELAQKLNVNFEIKTLVNDEELVCLLSNALCMIYTSQLEPFGFAPLEANACGTPVIALQEGGVKETIIDGKNGFLSNRNPQKIAKYLDFLAQNKDLREEMGIFAAQYVRTEWTLEKCTNNIENALESVLK
ncbi:glycosyltransferase family 4 protein [Emticicia sp. SJ17W-69]|uniref:glycosyltransferase family 4 protein n=1 Tax=Emticicia sp. SJ17W-69 TaxID=3421657 RepID=UPI003EBCD4C4